jgi:hypothetical protein
MILLIAAAVVGVTIFVVVIWQLRRRRHRNKLHGPVALLGPLISPMSRPLPRPTLVRGMPAVRQQYSTPPQDPFEQSVRYAPAPPPPEPVTPPAGVPRVNGNGDGDSASHTQPRPIERTLQFLPGRFEVITGGKALGSEIRFVRTGGPDGASITIGRSEGPAYRHIQLDVPTVSRRHAHMRWDGSRWSLTNLSTTNPVSINGVALPGEGTAIDLVDGDRVELGEVTFRFHAQ